MSDLVNKKCMPCEGGVLPFDVSEIHKYQKKVDGWDITKGEDEIFFLSKKFKFENFLNIPNRALKMRTSLPLYKYLMFSLFHLQYQNYNTFFLDHLY